MLRGAEMNLNASIIDQRLAGVQSDIQAWAADGLNIAEPGWLKSLAFVYLCVAMRRGQRLLYDLERGEAYFRAAVRDVEVALADLFGQKAVSTLQLSATFRRGDLIHKLLVLPLGIA